MALRVLLLLCCACFFFTTILSWPSNQFRNDDRYGLRSPKELEKSKQVGLSMARRLKAAGNKTLPPVFFVPGLGGSRLDAKLHDFDAPHFWCDSSTKDWFTLWVSIFDEELAFKCWLKQVVPVYEPMSGNWSAAKGVSIRPHDFGGLDGVMRLDPSRLLPSHLVDYFENMGSAFIAAGYQAGESLRAAPYNFLLPSEEFQENGAFDQWRTTIEEMYQQSGGVKVQILLHSYAGPTVLDFLNVFSSATWVQQHIGGIVSMAGSFGGEMKAIRAQVSGDSFGIPLFKNSTLLQLGRSMGSSASSYPAPAVWKKRPLVRVLKGKKVYTSADYAQLAIDAGFDATQQAIVKRYAVDPSLASPQVPIHCMYGIGTPTVSTWIYDDLQHDPVGQDNEPGDASLIALSGLDVCRGFAQNQTEPVTSRIYTSYKEADFHYYLIFNSTVISDVLNYLETFSK